MTSHGAQHRPTCIGWPARVAVFVAGAVALGAPVPGRAVARAESPRSAGMPVVALLRREGFAEYEQFVTAFRSRLRADTRLLAVRPDNASALLHYLRTARPALVLALGETAYRLAQRAGVAPLLAVYVFDGALASHQAVVAPLPPEEVLGLLTALQPQSRRVGLLSGRAPLTPAFARALTHEARRRRLQLVRLPSTSGAAAIRLLRREASRIDALWLLPNPDNLTSQLLRYAVALQLHRRLALIGVTRQQVRAGALFALDYAPEQLARVAAAQAHALLREHTTAGEDIAAGRGLRALKHQPASPGPPRLAINALTAARLGVDLSDWGSRAELITP